MRRANFLNPITLFALTGLVGCDSSSTPSTEAQASSTASSSASAAPEPTGKRDFTVMPDMVVDERGITVGPERIDLNATDGAAKLTETLGRVPTGMKQPAVRTVTKANIRDVGALLNGLGSRGFRSVLLKMDGARRDLLTEYVVVPERRVDKADDCSVVVSVLEDASTAVWSYRGGGGKKARKGLSGPDLSVTGDNVASQLNGCSSKTAFFSANSKMRWEHAFHVGALIRKTDAKSVVEELVFLEKEPVAGQPVKLEK